MADYRHTMLGGDRRVSPNAAGAVRLDAGIEAARMLRAVAVFGIAARLFYIYASARRISYAHTVMGLLDANGRIDLTGQPDRGAGLAARGNGADGLVTLAFWLSAIALILFIMSAVSLSRRRKRGDLLAAAVDKNRATRLAGRLYLLAVIVSVGMRNAFQQSPDAPRSDRVQAVIDGDTATIGLQVFVIAFLLIITLAVGREIGKARAAGRIG